MKTMTDATYLRALIAEGEHLHQDFKFEISDARKIAKTLSAFANTAGGRLLVGVKDNGRIAGIRSEEEQYMIEAAAQMYCRPQVECHMRTFEAEGKTVLLAEVPESTRKPVMACDDSGRWLAYLRIKDETLLATPVHLCMWRQSGREAGELLAYTRREQQLLDLLARESPLSLNRCCRLSGQPRHTVQWLLAKLVRYDVVELSFRDHNFCFSLK